jgi:SAM-dependent methyltransferase
MPTDYRDAVRKAILDGPCLVRATFSGHQQGSAPEWVKVTLRPVEVKGLHSVQFAYYTDKKCITKNHTGADLAASLEELLRLPFRHIQVATTTDTLQVNVSKSGKPLLHRTQAAQPIEAPDVAHDRQKDLLLPEGKPDAYLQAIGFMTADGRIRADKQRKFRQINEFLRLLKETGEIDKGDAQVLEIVDYGCGNAYLTFGLTHYLTHVLGRSAHVVGVDRQGDLLEKHAGVARSLGWTNVEFRAGSIAEFVPQAPTDITLALHACDTATDDALARGIQCGSRVIVSVPCCHHNLQEQLRGQEPPPGFRAVFRHGILAERQGDILTDTFRALILRIMGYQTEVMQFISPEHTARNIMIRSVLCDAPPTAAFVEDYHRLKELWRVTPWLETLLGEPLQQRLCAMAPQGSPRDPQS